MINFVTLSCLTVNLALCSHRFYTVKLFFLHSLYLKKYHLCNRFFCIHCAAIFSSNSAAGNYFFSVVFCTTVFYMYCCLLLTLYVLRLGEIQMNITDNSEKCTVIMRQ